MACRFTLFGADTPNPCKAVIALEEAGTEYDYREIDIDAGENREEWFRKISPSAKVPVLQDGHCHIWESGAILMHLSSEFGEKIPALRNFGSQTHSWLFFQSSSVGPLLGQLYYFQRIADPKVPAAGARFASEAARVLGVLETHLSSAEYLVDGSYSLADIAMWPWLEDLTVFDIDPGDFPAITRWRDDIARRPAVKRAVALVYGDG